MSIAQEKKIDNSKFENYEVFVAEVFERKLAEGREIIRKTLSELDVQLMAARDTTQYSEKGLRSTSIKTKLGTIEYKRHIYRDYQTGHHVYLLDNAIKASDIGLLGADITAIAKDMITGRSFRATAKMISESTGLSISHQAVWNIIQESGQREIKQTEEISKRVEKDNLHGNVETKLLYQESDGVWLKLQGKSRKKHGSSREMKIGIAYDGVIYQPQKDGKVRRILDNKVAFASFEPSKDFRRHHEAVIASVYNNDEIELRVKNGDGAKNLAALLCKAHSTAEPDLNTLKKSTLNKLPHIKQSAGDTPEAEGKGRDYPVRGTISPKLPEIADIGKVKWFST